MATVYTARLFTGTLPTNHLPIFTAPGAYTTVVRDVQVEVPITQSGQVLIDGSSATGLSIAALYFEVNPTGPSLYHWDGRLVLLPNDQLYGLAPTNEVVVTISGYLLVGLPPAS